MKIEIKYDKKADSVYLTFSEQKVAYSRNLDPERSVDYSEEGEIRGIQFLSASRGLKTNDLPYKSAIDRALNEKGVTGIMYKLTNNPVSEVSIHDNGDFGITVWNVRIDTRIKKVLLTIAIVLFFSGVVAADIVLMQNLIALRSVAVVLLSVLGLMVTLLPTVFGLLLLFAWIILATGLAKRFENENAGEDTSAE